MTPHSAGSSSLMDKLSEQAYWPAVAAKQYALGRFTEVMQLCRQGLTEAPYLSSGRIVLAKTLIRVGQVESAREQLYSVMSADPDNLAALKLLGDCAFAEGDEQAAFAQYARVLEIDPECGGLTCEVVATPSERTTTITLIRPEESLPVEAMPLRQVPFYTETMGDLYLAQGYPRLAASVFRVLHDRNRHPRILEKLRKAQEGIKTREQG